MGNCRGRRNKCRAAREGQERDRFKGGRTNAGEPILGEAGNDGRVH